MSDRWVCAHCGGTLFQHGRDKYDKVKADEGNGERSGLNLPCKCYAEARLKHDNSA